MSYLTKGPLVLANDGLLRMATDEQMATLEATPFPRESGVYLPSGKPLGAIHAVVDIGGPTLEVRVHANNHPAPYRVTLTLPMDRGT